MKIALKQVFALFVAVAPLFAFGQESRVDTLLRYMHDKGASRHVMVFAHRGNWRNSAENSLQAFQDCIDARLDGIEVDLRMTKDSVLVVMHDDKIDRTTTGKGLVSDYTMDELRQFSLLSPIGVKTRKKLPTFEEVLLLAKDKILIQVDKWQPYSKQIVELARRHDCERQIILRTTEKSDAIKRKYGNLFDNLTLMPVLVCKGGDVDNEKFEDFTRHFSSPVFSLSFTRADFPVLKRIPELRKAGYRIWMNSLWDTFNAGHDDEMAVADADNSYGWLLNQGADIIFTDNPMLLKEYLIKINRW